MDWQADACRDGLPLQREAMSEALEELLFDSDVVGARLEMLLPLDGGYWRVLQGVGADVFDSQASSAALKDCLDWPLDPLESYVMATPCADAVLRGCEFPLRSPGPLASGSAPVPRGPIGHR